MFQQQQKKKLISEHRRLCRQRKVLLVIISEAAFADHKIPIVRKWLLWVPNPHKDQISDKPMMFMFKAFSEILSALGLENPEPFTSLLDGSKFSGTLSHTVFSDAAGFLPHQREAM